MKIPTLLRAGAAACVLALVGIACLAGCTSFGRTEPGVVACLRPCGGGPASIGCGPARCSEAPHGAGLALGLGLEELPRADDLALLPTNVTGFVSVHLAHLLGKLGLKEHDSPLFKAWHDGVGVPLSAVERFTLAATDSEGVNRLLVVQTRRPIDRAAVLKACVRDHRTSLGIIETGKPQVEIHVGTKTGLAVHFPSKNLVIVADSVATMNHCLAKKKDVPAAELKAALARAVKSDVVAWGASKVPPAPAPAISYQPLARRVSRYQDTARFLPFLPLPLPASLVSGQLSLDLGDKLGLEMRFVFRDEGSARKEVKCVSRLVDLFRAECLSTAAETAAEEMDNEEQASPVHVRRMAELAGMLEKRLQKVEPRVERTTVTVAAEVPFEARQASAALLFLLEEGPDQKSEVTPGLFFQSGAAAGRPRAIPDTPPPLPPPPLPPPTVQTMVPPPHPPTPSIAKLTVANVRKEAVLLFIVDPQGELTFVKKLPAGEATDLKSVAGERWVAVFMSEPYRVKFVVWQPEATWLLR